ncbi:MAG: sensor histidine kinase [Solirubrobacteraceae bacterium]
MSASRSPRARRPPRIPARVGRIAHRIRHPHTTVRWRLTLLYGAMFLASGAAMLAITYTLVDHASFGSGPFPERTLQLIGAPGSVVTSSGVVRQLPTGQKVFITPAQIPVGLTVRQSGSVQVFGPLSAEVRAQVKKLLATAPGRKAARVIGTIQRNNDLSQLVEESAIALGIMALISTALGWLVAGRVLAPLRTITSATQEISAANLNRRLALEGPRDELRQLSDTIDGLLARLEGAFVAQRRFVADASHELRTPLTTTRALLELVLSDPRATAATFRDTCEQVLDESTHQEQLIDALLALAQGQRGLDRREPVDLGIVVGDAARSLAAEAVVRGIALDVELAPEKTVACGDRRLLERLVANLIENGLRHNIDGGWVRASVQTASGGARVLVSNSGSVVPAEAVERLLEPFQRLSGERGTYGDGLGLGLSIVKAIADAHDGELRLRSRVQGGLDAEVCLPAPRPPERRPIRSDECEPAKGLTDAGDEVVGVG